MDAAGQDLKNWIKETLFDLLQDADEALEEIPKIKSIESRVEAYDRALSDLFFWIREALEKVSDPKPVDPAVMPTDADAAKGRRRRLTVLQ